MIFKLDLHFGFGLVGSIQRTLKLLLIICAIFQDLLLFARV